MTGYDENAKFEESRSFWYCQVDIDVLRDPGLSTTDKAIYAVLCSYMSVGDRSGGPSIGTLAEVCGCSKNTVRTAIKNLIAKGVIERKDRFYDGRQTSCVYKVIGTQSHGGSKFEGGRVQNLKGGGSKSGKAELEPKELELKDPSSKGADAPDEQNPLSPNEEAVPVNEEPIFVDDTALKKIPSAMQETVEFMLLKTGRSRLLPEEIGPIMALEKIHLPSRIQREISRAADRFKSKGKTLSSLTFVYIYDSLKYQQSKSKKPTGAEAKPPEMSEDDKAWEAANMAKMEAEFGAKGGVGNAGQR